MAFQIARSQVDEDRFGIRVARASQVTADNLPAVIDYCRDNEIRLLIARVPVTEIHSAQAVERVGFLLMDTLLYYSRNLVRTPIPTDTGQVPVRAIREGEDEQVRAVAAESFKGYFGHYHADDRLERAKADEGYVDWATKSATSREVADEVLVADKDGSIAGFATLRWNNPKEGEGVLFGVAPSAQGLGIYRSFIVQAMNWFAERGAETMIVSTQITNLAVQKVWVRVGFELSHAYYTFHKWFDEPAAASN